MPFRTRWTTGFAAINEETLTINVGQLLANDRDADKKDVLMVPGVANGTGTTASLFGDTITVEFNDGFTGQGNFSYAVSDGHGGIDTAKVFIDVAPPPPPPTLRISDASGNEGEAITFIATLDRPFAIETGFGFAVGWGGNGGADSSDIVNWDGTGEFRFAPGQTSVEVTTVQTVDNSWF